MPQEPDRVIQLSWAEVRTHASCKTVRTWENDIKQINDTLG